MVCDGGVLWFVTEVELNTLSSKKRPQTNLMAHGSSQLGTRAHESLIAFRFL